VERHHRRHADASAAATRCEPGRSSSTTCTRTSAPTFVGVTEPFFDLPHSSTQQALYVQNETKVTSWLIANGGLRYDRYEQFDRVTPRAAVIVLPSSAQSFKYLYGGAFRAPNFFEQNDFYFGDRVHALRPEAIDTHEFVWERYFNDRLRTAVSTYWYKADRLIHAGARRNRFSLGRRGSTWGWCGPRGSSRSAGAAAGANRARWSATRSSRADRS
jgi:outer membrane receptor protein involved in Fe transport